MRCTRCNRDNSATNRFCAGCGAALVPTCSACGAAHEADAAFCGKCGAPFAIAQQPLSQTTAGAAQDAAPDGERRHLTVMFTDLENSTALSQQLDPEDFREVLRSYQSACAEVVARYTGRVGKFLGDGLLAYFGYPQAHDDDAQRAVFAGLAIVAAVGRLNGELVPRGISLIVRVGIHSGLAVLGEMGSGERVERADIVGETPQVAARLQSVAAPNTVVISAATHRIVRDYFTYEPLGPRAIRGIAQPLDVYRVVGGTGVTSRLDTGAELTPFVGREEEQALLLERWRLAAAGTLQTVIVNGEPGIGKSRLVRVLRDRLSGQPVTTIEVRCSQLYQNSALYPVIDLIERLLGFSAADSPEQKVARIEQGLDQYGLPLDELVPLFAALLSLPLPPRYKLPPISPELQRQRTHEAIVAWLLAAAAREPLLLIVEDLHWSDPSTLDVVGLVGGQQRSVPIMVVLTHRPEFQPLWSAESHVTTLRLERLADEEIGKVVDEVAGGRRLPEPVNDQILARADGVPLFAEELTKAVLASDLLAERDGRYELRQPLQEPAIPVTLQDTLMARLDRHQQAKAVAQVGATLGREFDYAFVSAVSELDNVSLREALELLADAGLLYRRGAPPAASYAFKHALIQDAAYQSLLRSTRRELHRKAARAIEERFTDLAARQPELVAHHFTEAGLAGEAVGYWQQAGSLAEKRASYAEAAQHYDAALSLLPALPEGAARDEMEMTLQNGLGNCAAASVGYAAPEVERAYARAMELAQPLEAPQAIEAVWGLWTFYYMRGDYAQAMLLTEQGLRIGQATQKPELLITAYCCLGWGRITLGEFEAARKALVTALELNQLYRGEPKVFPQVQDMGVSSAALLGVVLAALGYPDQALRSGRDALSLLQEPHVWNPEFSTGMAENHAAWCTNILGQPGLAFEHAQRCVEIGTRHGFPTWQLYGMSNLAVAKVALGQTDEAISMLTQGIAAFRAVGFSMGLTFYLLGLARAYVAAGNVDAARRTVAEGLELAERTGNQMDTAELYRLRGELTLAQDAGAVESAAGDLLQALNLAEVQRARLFELRAALSLHRLRTAQGRGDETRPRLAAVYDWFREGFDLEELREARALLQPALPA